MTIEQYIKSKGLTTRLVAQKAQMSKQAINNYGVTFTPTAKTLLKLAKAMTELGAPTTVVDLVKVMYTDELKTED